MNRLAARRWRLRHFPPPARGDWAVPGDPTRFDLFLLMGQSNMAGFGGIRPDDPWQPGDFDPVPGVLALGGQATLKDPRRRGLIRWRPAAHPLHLNQASAGFGLGLPFAEFLRAARPGQAVGLIPCAWGGAPIRSLGPGSPMLENTMLRLRYARQFGCLRAVLWHQGESDAQDAASAAAHAGRLRALIRALRSERGLADLPILIGDLADFSGPAENRMLHDQVRAGLRMVVATDPHAAFVESGGLAKVDKVHFGREALIDFGRRYARAHLD